MSNKLQVVRGKSHIERARIIAKTLGIRVAGKYLRNRGWSIEAARWVLFGK